MADSERSVGVPVLVSFALTALALVVGIPGHRALLGGLLALVGMGLGCYAIVIGVQAKTQGKMVLGILAAVAGAGAAVLLFLFKVLFLFTWL